MLFDIVAVSLTAFTLEWLSDFAVSKLYQTLHSESNLEISGLSFV